MNYPEIVLITKIQNEAKDIKTFTFSYNKKVKPESLLLKIPIRIPKSNLILHLV